jgi:hypothetical protein
MNGFWEGAGILLGIAFFFAFANAASRMAQGVPRFRAYRNAVLAAAIFAGFSYFTHSGYHTVDADPLTGAGGEVVEDDPPAHPVSKLDSSIKIFVICLGCFCYGVYKSDPTKQPEPAPDRGMFN